LTHPQIYRPVTSWDKHTQLSPRGERLAEADVLIGTGDTDGNGAWLWQSLGLHNGFVFVLVCVKITIILVRGTCQNKLDTTRHSGTLFGTGLVEIPLTQKKHLPRVHFLCA